MAAEVSRDELETAMEATSSMHSLTEPWISLETGEVHIAWDEGIHGEMDQETPPDIDDRETWNGIPTNDELDLGRRLAFDFARVSAPGKIEVVYDMFGCRGAYRRFKDWLASEGLRDQWFEFEEAQTTAAIRASLDDHGLALRER